MRAKVLLIILAAGITVRAATGSVPSARRQTSGSTDPLNGAIVKAAKWAEMEKSVRKKASTFKGEIGLVIRDLDTGRVIEINPDTLFPAASMIKVPIMAACLRAADEGRLSLQDNLKLKKVDKVRGSGDMWRKRPGSVFNVGQLIDLMITRSDNTAANMLIDLLGFEYINQAFKEMGLEKTVLSRKMMDLHSRDLGVENYTTAREMADIIERMYRKDCVCSEVSDKCMAILKSQKVNDRIPRLLPKTTVVAHKTGLERQICHDAGIVFTENGNFLISVFTKTWRGPRTAKYFIAGVSSIAYSAYKPVATRTRTRS
jgi:beta-lactamase class A